LYQKHQTKVNKTNDVFLPKKADFLGGIKNSLLISFLHPTRHGMPGLRPPAAETTVNGRGLHQTCATTADKAVRRSGILPLFAMMRQDAAFCYDAAGCRIYFVHT
jgi:hypothetical protein